MRYEYITNLADVKMNRQLRDGMSAFLSRYPWSWFATLTFEEELRSFTARHRLENWLTTIERRLHRVIPVFVAEEFLDTRWTPHYHLLVGNVGDQSRGYWWSQWYHRKGNGSARILPYRAEGGAGHYITKYVVKDRYSRGYWLARRMPPPEEAQDWVVPGSQELPAEAEEVVRMVVAMFGGERRLVK